MEEKTRAEEIAERRAKGYPKLDDLIARAEERILLYKKLSPKDQDTWKSEYRKVCGQLERYKKYKERQ